MMNWHLCWYVVQNSFFRFSPKENVCTYLVRAELFYIAHYQHVPVPVEGFKNWGARNNFTSFERICFAFFPGKIWGRTCIPPKVSSLARHTYSEEFGRIFSPSVFDLRVSSDRLHSTYLPNLVQMQHKCLAHKSFCFVKTKWIVKTCWPRPQCFAFKY